MKEHPIIMSRAMIRAYQAGHKTETRRIPNRLNARYEVGDRLWFKETWRTCDSYNALAPLQLPLNVPIEYIADDLHGNVHGRIRSSIYLPRFLSRYTPLITVIRRERLQDLTEESANAEGVEAAASSWPQRAYAHLWESINGDKPGCAWRDNPEVLVIQFERFKESV